MNSQLRTIAPAPARVVATTSYKVEKRQRIGVRTACELCRLRKTRCDGVQPRCTPCLKHKSECFYDPGLAETQAYADLIRSFLQGTETEAIELLQRLRSTGDSEAAEPWVNKASSNYVQRLKADIGHQTHHEGSRIPSRNPASDPKTACDWRLHNLGPIPAKVFQLTELVYNLLPITCDPSEALAVYTRCLEWYDDIFPRLQTSGNGTPFTLFVHMYYHFCLLCLFQPLIKIAPTNLEAQPRNICTQAARAILDLSESSTRLFSHLQAVESSRQA
ncbi:nitrate assimilation regulatory protein nirA [Ophiocordyceps camponoti-floridani]|uniref:Nitrate assimilation regulatory protein nirA n=1 Tax=Ophiocordyceps camponoti-floridani TaxID=2030778 RepID=A0A8H4Q740_9HYPO|nr:nitrate assimilation regulatory protein nirA [Ophiocordyceps camponoti-floridani]